MLEARAPIAIFTDADLSSPISEADKLLGVLGGVLRTTYAERAL